MSSFDRIAKILSLSSMLNNSSTNQANSRAAGLNSMMHMMQMPQEMAMRQQAMQMAPEMQQAELARMKAATESQNLENIGNINQGVRQGLRGQYDARGIDTQGIPAAISPEQLLQAFQLVMGKQEIPSDLVEQLRYSPGAGQLLSAIEQAYNK